MLELIHDGLCLELGSVNVFYAQDGRLSITWDEDAKTIIRLSASEAADLVMKLKSAIEENLTDLTHGYAAILGVDV